MRVAQAQTNEGGSNPDIVQWSSISKLGVLGIRLGSAHSGSYTDARFMAVFAPTRVDRAYLGAYGSAVMQFSLSQLVGRFTLAATTRKPRVVSVYTRASPVR